MAAWCFVCDAPVEGTRCSGCGRPATVVEDAVPEPAPRPRRRVPRWVWLTVAVLLLLSLFPLLQAGLGLH